MTPTPTPTGAPAIEVVPVAWLDAGDRITEHDPALSDEESASANDWRTVESVERRVTACRVVVHFEDGDRATGYPEQLVVRVVGSAS
ncbi:hypothetical protein [Actinomycetospora cinnamomea]|uniref:Uncharacterized protein n=1 Tax=Actinomycetospora cinnamomea TaxID=663609 RepID=A0A2U1FDX4_9PSEU|nr:hypothetical protein [Actinomycetospora cinnamomea]PVZ10160.1 hypothetical protein C8D89_105237 [Actinomycetospora cinnamomea]